MLSFHYQHRNREIILLYMYVKRISFAERNKKPKNKKIKLKQIVDKIYRKRKTSSVF